MIVAGHVWGKLLTRASFQPSLFLPKLGKRCFESNSGEGRTQNLLTQTSILVQDGADIHEVPLIVRRLNDLGAICSGKDNKGVAVAEHRSKFHNVSKGKEQINVRSKSKKTQPSSTTRLKETAPNKRIDIETDEGTAILFCSDLECLENSNVEEALQELNSRNTTRGVYSLLEGKIAHEINCRVALEGLRKIVNLESSLSRYKSPKNARLEVDVVNRDAVLQQLTKLIAKSQDSEMIVQGLVVLRKDRVSPARNIYRDWMCDEALIRATDGEFSLHQLITVIKVLSSYKDTRYRTAVDTLWIGIASRKEDIDADILVPLFKLLKYFDRSRNMVKIILEKKLSDHWLSLNGSQIAEILNCFHKDSEAANCLISASKWVSVSMNTSLEKDLTNLIRSLNTKNYVDERIEKALEQYMKAKRSAIKDPNLVSTIMTYCKDLQMRNVCIFTECGEYFIKHGKNIPTALLSSVLAPFGLLDVQPPSSEKFWKMFDEVLTARFHNIKLTDMLDILLSCTYLEKYPIKFTNRIFTSHYLSKLYKKTDTAFISGVINKLKLLDATMFLECKDYKGPRFSFRTNRVMEESLFADNRIRKIVNIIYSPLATLVGGEQKLSKSVLLSQLPLIQFYILDVVIHPLLASKPVFNLNLLQRRNINTAVLICLPEYYCRNGNRLIGTQIMKKRHIRKLGFRVVSLNYKKLEKLSNHSDKLLSYLSQRLDSVEDAL